MFGILYPLFEFGGLKILNCPSAVEDDHGVVPPIADGAEGMS